MYSISAYNLDGSGGVLYNPEHIADDTRAVYDISPIEKELGKAGSFSFTIPRANPLYDSVYRFGTEISVYRHPGDLLWMGRVTSVSKDFYLNKTVRCEGALSYLNDIIVRPFIYRNATGHTFCVSPLAHYARVSGEYTMHCSDGRRLNFTTTIDQSDTLAYTAPYFFTGVSEYITVREAMDDILELDDELSLDMIYTASTCSVVLGRIPFTEMTAPESGAVIEFGKNMLDYTDEYENDDICTAVVPLGKNNRVLYNDNDDIDMDSFTSTNLAAKYGRIEKVLHFDSANSDLRLRNCTNAVLRMLERDDKPRIRLKAVDLFHLGLNADVIDVGWKVPLSSSRHGMYPENVFVCTNLSMDIENPENSSYTFRRM